MTNRTLTDSYVGKKDLQRAVYKQLPGRISGIIDNWHQLNREGWDDTLLSHLIDRIQSLIDAGESHGIVKIKQEGLSLLSHLNMFRESSIRPEKDDIAALDGLIHAFTSFTSQIALETTSDAPLSTQKDTANQPCRIFVLGLDDTQIPGLTIALQKTGFQVEKLRNLRPLFERRDANDGTQYALLSHIDHLPYIYPNDKQNSLWRHDARLAGAPVAFISDTDDIQARLKAIRIGAKAFWRLPTDPVDVAKHIWDLTCQMRKGPARVLVVDDDSDQAYFTSVLLEKANFECRLVTDPFLVMPALAEFKPDLILMDLYMPGASGTELTQIIHLEPDYVDIPIVFLSGEQDMDKQLTALSSGGDDFLSKPIDPKKLITTVKNRVRRARELSNKWGGPAADKHYAVLHTKGYLFERIEGMLFSNPGQGRAVAAFHIAIDNADALLDQIGYGGLDSLIFEIAEQITPLLSPDDVLGHFGDASLGLIAWQPSVNDLKSFGVKLCRKIAEHVYGYEAKNLRITVSIGGFVIDDLKLGPNALFSFAEQSCLHTQQQGGNSFELHQSMPDEHPVIADHVLEQLIKKAVESSYLEIFFQPVVDLKRKSDKAFYQALVKLREPKGRLLSASAFLPTAEKIGVINVIDQWMTRAALKAINLMRQKGKKLHLFVPQSIELIYDMNRLTRLNQRYNENQICEDALTFEFKLADVSSSLNAANSCFTVLEKLNITVSLTGVNANTIELRKALDDLPIRFIKLSPRLLGNMSHGLQDIIDLAHCKSIKVIAPQVEDPHSIAVLWKSGADFVQGNFIQQPHDDLNFDFNDSVLY